MADPLISIVIPTRQRAATLGPALATALEQDEPRIEVIVSDNFSTDATQEVVKAVSDPRLCYVRTPYRMSISDHWEFALERAQGEFVTFIGDDDGIMPRACTTIRRLSESLQLPIFHWGRFEYVWPGADKGPALFAAPPPREPQTIDIIERARSSVANGGAGTNGLPKLYHSAVSRELLQGLRDRTGRVFHSTQPDVFLAFALPAMSRYALDVGTRLTVNGRSSASIGYALTSHRSAPDKASITRAFGEEYAQYRVSNGVSLPYISMPMLWIADAMLTAMRLFPEVYRGVDFNYSAFYAIHAAARPWYDLATAIRMVRARGELRRHHGFSAATFIQRYFALQSTRILNRVRSELSRRRGKVAIARPADVRECVEVLAGLAR